MGNTKGSHLNQHFSNDPVFPQNLICTVQATTQIKDDSGLYDFDQKGYRTVTLNVRTSGFFYRGEKRVRFLGVLDSKKIDESKYTKLAYLFQTQDGIFLKKEGTESGGDNDLWLALKKTDKYQCAISVGDQFKLGRIRLRVNEMSSSPTQANSIEYSAMQKYNSVYNSVQNCRVCLSVEGDSPLIRPCNCDGSVAYIHVNCLREWFKNKVQAVTLDTKSGNVLYYAWKNLECEICKKQYQYNFEVDQLKFKLFDMAKPNGPYIIFESLTKDRNSLKGLYMVNMSNTQTVRIGRGQDIDMRLLDISVSRVHTLIHHQKGKFIISDFGSKFGTLVYVRDKINLVHEQFHKGQFMISQTLIEFDLSCKKENVLQCFGQQKRIAKTESNVLNNLSSPMYSMSEDSDEAQQLKQLESLRRDEKKRSVFEVKGLNGNLESIVSTTDQQKGSLQRTFQSDLPIQQQQRHSQQQQLSPRLTEEPDQLRIILEARSKSEVADDCCESYLQQSRDIEEYFQ